MKCANNGHILCCPVTCERKSQKSNRCPPANACSLGWSFPFWNYKVLKRINKVYDPFVWTWPSTARRRRAKPALAAVRKLLVVNSGEGGIEPLAGTGCVKTSRHTGGRVNNFRIYSTLPTNGLRSCSGS